MSLISPAVLSEMVRTAKHTPPGAWVEVGVYQGGSARLLYAARWANPLHLFDTFTGIPFWDPEEGDKHDVGEFDGSGSLAGLRTSMPDACFHVGLFPQTLPDNLRSIAFAHIDCDQYRSVDECIVHLWPRIVPGGVMWFDDFGALLGARRAVLKHFSENQLQHGPEGRRYVVKL